MREIRETDKDYAIIEFVKDRGDLSGDDLVELANYLVALGMIKRTSTRDKEITESLTRLVQQKALVLRIRRDQFLDLVLAN